MRFDTFAMERLQSTWENRVSWNLAESGVHPLRVDELAETDDERQAVLGQELGYTQTNGTPELRSLIANLYPGATPEHVQVTNGGSEANCIALWYLLDSGDGAVLMVPNYMQALGLARGLGAVVSPWPLVHESTGTPRWRVDLESLDRLVKPGTRLILICNPNNPTGSRLSDAELNEICRIAGRVGAWVIADEIYRGAELDGRDTPSLWGRYERAIVTSGLSKAYGLPGLRIGWVVAPPSLIEELWGLHDYTTIAPAAVSDRLARIALAPARRDRLLTRTRRILRANYPLVEKWIGARAPALSHAAPEAGAIVFIRYQHAINSTALIERARDEQSVLVVPGDHFEMDGHIRIGFGSDPANLSTGLEKIGAVLDTIPVTAVSDAR